MSDESTASIQTREENPNVDASDVDEISTSNTMRERAGETRVKTWVVLDGSRLLVTGMMALLIFGVFVFGGTFFYQHYLTDALTADTVETVFSTMIAAIITGVTLVLTISQIVISQENGPLGDQHERMSSTMDFREYTKELTGSPVPADPSKFLRALILESKDYATNLRDSVADNDNETFRGEVAEFTDSLVENADAAADRLKGRKFGSYTVVAAGLDYNYSWKIFQVERIVDEYADDISDETLTVFNDLKTILSIFGPARQHIKTLYFEWELISLSQNILYLSVPALIVAGFITTYFGGSAITGESLGVPNLIWMTASGFAVTSLPFLLLISYIARLATIAKRTLAVGPFILRDSQR
ncbi:hypothetical protein SAMN04487948_11557 [Halogranum amylolyticum]|uniref:Uncharacterized protein n=1 Tax=Halogranum amylolyticum TaxID=660520 RepID=A0A1H8VBW1_9EURY|nr:hypothetical protein [Halogranum amylolyticum]SEP12677.1 hypothetical protein SAMN04487948_11557 [Halogranum amylolyticum]